jgi:hypothetical protein
MTDTDPHSQSNEELDKVGKLEEQEDKLDESVAPEPERQKLARRKKFAFESKPIG